MTEKEQLTIAIEFGTSYPLADPADTPSGFVLTGFFVDASCDEPDTCWVVEDSIKGLISNFEDEPGYELTRNDDGVVWVRRTQ